MTFKIQSSITAPRKILHARCGLISAFAGAAFLLGACQEAEIILPGKREDIGSVLQNTVEETQNFIGNESRAISLGQAVSNAAWTQGVGMQEYRVSHAALAGGLEMLWSAKIGAGDSRKQRITADPVVGNGLVFTLDSNALVSATNLSGQQVWSRDIMPARDKAGDATGGGLALHEGTLYAAIGFGELVAMDAGTGDVLWRQKLDATATGRPMVYDGMVYLLAGDDTGWALEADSGRIAWQISGSESLSNVLGAPAPVIAGELAIFAFGSGELQAVFRRGGLRRWDASVLGRRPGMALSRIDDVTGTPVVDNGVLYAGNQAGRMVAVNAGNGARIWTVNEGAIGPMWPAGDSVFAVSDRNELLRLDASDGSKIWGYKLPNYVKDRPRKIAEVFTHHGPIIAGGRLIVASNDGKLRSFDPESGALTGTVEIPGGASTAPVVAQGTLYVVGQNGQLYAFR